MFSPNDWDLHFCGPRLFLWMLAMLALFDSQHFVIFVSVFLDSYCVWIINGP